MDYSIDLSHDGMLNLACKLGVLKIELINLNKNYTAYNWTLFKDTSRTFDTVKDNITRIHITHNFNELLMFSIIDNKLIPVESEEVPNFNLPFICMTGHSGGGTSIVAKSFKYMGINMGNDSGDFSNRKTHESVSIRSFIDKILTNENSRVLKSYSKVLASYKYDHAKLNAFKITDLEIKLHLANGVGLSKLFKNIKFVSIVKPHNGKGASPEGKRFNNASELDIYKNQHPKVQAPIFHIDWNRYFTDYTYVNEVLHFIGADIVLHKGDFEEMLKAIKFQPSSLKV